MSWVISLEEWLEIMEGREIDAKALRDTWNTATFNAAQKVSEGYGEACRCGGTIREIEKSIVNEPCSWEAPYGSPQYEKVKKQVDAWAEAELLDKS